MVSRALTKTLTFLISRVANPISVDLDSFLGTIYPLLTECHDAHIPNDMVHSLFMYLLPYISRPLFAPFQLTRNAFSTCSKISETISTRHAELVPSPQWKSLLTYSNS